MRVPIRTQCFTALLLVLMTAATACSQPAATNDPGARERNIARLVARLLQKLHISHRAVDDTISQRAYGLYMQMLDPRKLYFTEQDADEFAPLSTKLDDHLLQGDVGPAFNIFRRLLQRMEERQPLVARLLESDFDFEVDEDIVVDSEEIEYAASDAAIADRWRREIKWRLLAMESDAARETEPASEQAANREGPSTEDSTEDTSTEDTQRTPKERVERRFAQQFARMKRLDAEKLFELYLSSIAAAYDPHTTYMSPNSMEQFMIQMSLNLEGIGAELREEDGYTSIVRIMDGGAASKTPGIAVGDKILALAQGAEGDWTDVSTQSVERIASQVLGKRGTTLRMRLESKAGKVKEVSLQRTRLELQKKAVKGHVIQAVADNGEARRVGYIDLPAFYKDVDAMRKRGGQYRSCSRDVASLLDSFRNQSADAVILDLRGNGGGYLDEAIDIVGLFIDEGPVVQVRAANGPISVYRDMNRGVSWDGPLVILTDTNSASASEIVAGAIQDYGRGIVVGDRQTHGKGTVQSPVDVARSLMGELPNLPNFGALKVTMQTYYLPSGKSTQSEGITANVALPTSRNYATMREDDLKHALPQDQVAKADYRRLNFVTDSIVEKLNAASKERTGVSEEFGLFSRRMQAMEKRADEARRSLVKSEFELAREVFLEGATELEPASGDAEGDADDEEKSFPVDTYDEEVLEIVQDYVTQLEPTG